jgi:hypothetical protein
MHAFLSLVDISNAYISLYLLPGFGVHFDKQNVFKLKGSVTYYIRCLWFLHHALWYNYTTQTKEIQNFLN